MPEPVKPLILVSVDEKGSLNIQIDGFSPIMLWGIARMIERRGDEVDFQQKMLAESKKPRLVRA